jgi:hypothetical protein
MCLVIVAVLPLTIAPAAVDAVVGHLVISELVTGGASASDELIEVYNPSAEALPLEGLELVYVTASGATISRRAAWSLGAVSVPPGGHLLVANELGVFAPVADAVYASGMAATGGSVALRIQGAATAIDALGWGTATSTWLEGAPAPAPAAGASLERRPGGEAGSTIDTDDNAADFLVRSVPDPQNASSPAVPDPTSSPSAEPTSSPSAEPTLPPPSGTPPPAAQSVASARGLPDGSWASIQGTALTASDFGDGGGYVADESGGIAVLLDAGSFARGDLVVVSGTIDDRFAQRTLRAASATAASGGAAILPIPRTAGAIDESVEGRLVTIAGVIDGGATVLSGGLAFDVADPSGSARVVIGTAAGIDTASWTDGRSVVVTGVVGQRDSSGTGLEGYRVQPRDPEDVELLPVASPTPSPSPSGTAGPTPSPSASATPSDLSTIAEARAAAKNARLTVRGVVTLASGTIEPGSAVMQDATGAILLRLGDEAGDVELGQLVEVDGTRSTKAGMESLRVSEPPRPLGTAPEPAPRPLRTGEAGEPHEAELVVVRGALVASARRASSGSVSFDVDDGSGPVHVIIGAQLAADDESLERGAWVEVTGPLGQDTTGAQPLRGYRIWPRDADGVRILAAATSSAGGAADEGDDDRGRGRSGGGGSAASDSLNSIGAAALDELRIGATLVAAGWDEAGLAGLLWDGRILVGVAAGSGGILDAAVGERRPPLRVELGHLSVAGTDPRFGITVVTLGTGPGDVVIGTGLTQQPLGRFPSGGAAVAWVSLVGSLSGDRFRVAGTDLGVEELCAAGRSFTSGSMSVTGVALRNPDRIVVPCGGVRPTPSLTLARSVEDPSRGSAAANRSAARIGPVVAGREDGRRGLAAGLLGAGVGMVLVATIIRRRLRGGTPQAVDQPEPVIDGDALADVPRLTLVSVPREHG